jgi:hypothetical protein
MNVNTGTAARKVRPGAPNATREAAELLSRGLAVCRIDHQEKKPTYRGWSTRSLGAEDFAADDLIGIMGGPLSDGRRPGHALVIIDLDDAAALEKADGYLPPTGMTEGRAGKPRSHRYYLVPLASVPEAEHSTAEQAAPAAVAATGHPGPRTRSFRATDGREILRLIGTGGQAVCPPSLHPSGEPREWDGPDGRPGRPAVVAYPDLRAAVEGLAAACGWVRKEAVAPAGGAPPAGGGESAGLDGRLERRVLAYLDACPPAVSGRGGHDQLFRVAIALAHGFALAAEVAVELLTTHYNPRCRPPWTTKEIRHKVEDALAAGRDKPRGHLLARSGGNASAALPDDTPAIVRRAFAARVGVIAARAVRGNRRGAGR